MRLFRLIFKCISLYSSQAAFGRRLDCKAIVSAKLPHKQPLATGYIAKQSSAAYNLRHFHPSNPVKSRLAINSNSIPMSKRKARPILFKLQNNRCLMCNQPFSNHIPCEIHHIDHNSSNNTLHNYAALCSNCHAGHHRYGLEFPHKKHLDLYIKSPLNESNPSPSTLYNSSTETP